MFHNYKINKTHTVNQTCYNFTNDAVIHKHNTTNTNDTYNVSKTNNLLHVADNNCFTKNIYHTTNITNNITRHSHINNEHNVIKKIQKHTKHIIDYETDINYYSKKCLNKETYYNFYNDNLSSERLNT